MLAEQQAIERKYRRRDNSDEYTSRTVWTEWVLESDLDYTESATSTSTTPPTVTTPPAAEDNPA